MTQPSCPHLLWDQGFWGEGHRFVLASVLSSSASSAIFGLKGYVAERKGEREEMQDAHVILNDITEECRPPSSLM